MKQLLHLPNNSSFTLERDTRIYKKLSFVNADSNTITTSYTGIVKVNGYTKRVTKYKEMPHNQQARPIRFPLYDGKYDTKSLNL